MVSFERFAIFLTCIVLLNTPQVSYGSPPSTAKAEEEEFDEAVAEPSSTRAIELWDRYLEKYLTQARGPTISAFVLKARRYNDLGNFGGALKTIENHSAVWDCAACRANAHVELARAHMMQGTHTLAIKELDAAVGLVNTGKSLSNYDVRVHDILELRSQTHFSMKNYKQALEDIDSAVARGEMASSAKLTRSVFLIALGQGQQAGEDARYHLDTHREPDEQLDLAIAIGYFGYLLDGKTDAAGRLLNEANKRLNSPGITFPRIAYLAKGITYRLLAECASSEAKKTDVQCILALQCLAKGEALQKHVDWVSKYGQPNRPTYVLTRLAGLKWPDSVQGKKLEVRKIADVFGRPLPEK